MAAVLAVALATALAPALGGCQAGTPAPKLGYTLLDGSRHSTDELRGKVVLVNFWATSCSTCMKEMPKLVETHEKFKDRGFTTLSVAMKYDPPAYVINYVESRKLPFPVAMDHDGTLAAGFDKVQLTPTTFVLNRKGEIVKRYVGEPDFAALHALLEELLKQQA